MNTFYKLLIINGILSEYIDRKTEEVETAMLHIASRNDACFYMDIIETLYDLRRYTNIIYTTYNESIVSFKVDSNAKRYFFNYLDCLNICGVFHELYLILIDFRESCVNKEVKREIDRILDMKEEIAHSLSGIC